MQQLNVRITDEEAAALDFFASQTEGIITKQGLVRLLIRQAAASNWQPLDSEVHPPLQPPVRGANKSSSASEEQPLIKEQPLLNAREKKPKNSFSIRAISPDLVPDDLLDCQQLLPEFWAAKKGTRSEGVWNRVCNKLRQWTPEQRREALERAIANGWGDVFEPKAAPALQRSAPAARIVPNQPLSPTMQAWLDS